MKMEFTAEDIRYETAELRLFLAKARILLCEVE
jgi:hypothetical protein